jgi:hypothetical protein
MAAAAAAKLAPQIIGLLTGGKARGGAGENAPSIGQARFEFQGLKEGAAAVVDFGTKVVQFLNPAHQFAAAIQLTTDTFAKGMAVLTEPLQAVTAGFKSMHETVTAVGASTAEFVKYADPAAVQRWEFAVKDGMAAIGHAITPITLFGEAFSRAFADLTAATAPAISAGLTRALQPLIDGLPKLLDTAGPLVRVVGGVADSFGRMGETLAKLVTSDAAVNALSAAFELFEQASQPVLVAFDLLSVLLTKVAKSTGEWLKELNDLLGIGAAKSKGKIAGGSVGLAATNAKMGSVESFVSDAFLKAFQVGNKPANPAVRTAGALERIVGFLGDGGLLDVMEAAIRATITEWVEALARAIPGTGAARALGDGDLPGAAKALGLPKGAVDAIRDGRDRLAGLEDDAEAWARRLAFWRP